MKHFSAPLTYRSAAFAAVMACGVPVAARHTAAGEDLAVRELRAALEVARQKIESERNRADAAETARQELVKSLGEAVRVSEEQAMLAREVRLKLEAFGVDLFTRSEDSIEQRLLKAVRDLDISQQQIDSLDRSLHTLGEAFMKYLQETQDAPQAAREEALAAIEATSGALEEGGTRSEDGVSGARVVSIDSEIGLIVVDAGRDKGLRVGTPVVVLRGERPVYSALIVDVRDAICGALLQEQVAAGETVQIGDRIRLLPNHLN